jgi:hypothetical protein
MIEGGWPYILASYAAMSVAFLALVVIVALRLRHWAERARSLDQLKRERAP